MDISDDSKLIVTCSADKNVKIWGLDFGDCHKSIFAHDESVMQVAFENNSHYFWTVGKDKMLKYWDADKVFSDPLYLSSLPTVYFALSLRTYKSLKGTMAKSGPWHSVITETLLLRVLTISRFVFGKN
jgi:WD40 repeat protein